MSNIEFDSSRVARDRTVYLSPTVFKQREEDTSNVVSWVCTQKLSQLIRDAYLVAGEDWRELK